MSFPVPHHIIRLIPSLTTFVQHPNVWNENCHEMAQAPQSSEGIVQSENVTAVINLPNIRATILATILHYLEYKYELEGSTTIIEETPILTVPESIIVELTEACRFLRV